MLQLEILVLELNSIDRLPACSVAHGKISALTHEAWNDTVKAALLEMQRLPRLSDALHPTAECEKILRSLRSDVLPEFHHNALHRWVTEGYVEENSRIRSADDPGQKQWRGAHKIADKLKSATKVSFESPSRLETSSRKLRATAPIPCARERD